ncbi:MAG: hypothetical protein KC635_15045 [Myxococcales bacterium]|nr:hypothetical protein [Myxococcales bacterium]MCB9733196.1 hypothetical protein [Deltaproteobacteria bacterium]
MTTTTTTLTSSEHAVLVNPRANRASKELIAAIGEIVSPDHVYVCDDGDDYRDVVDALLTRGYGTVFTAGGDGTVHRFINELDARDTAASPPRIGIVALGAGNGLAGVVSGGGGDPLNDLRTYVLNPSADTLRLGLCEAEGVQFAYGSLGLEASALRDFRALLGAAQKGPLRRAFHGRAGYVTAIFGMTLPRRLFRKKVGVKVTLTGARGHAATDGDSGAELGRAYAPGDVLYEGPANAVLMGTCPFFGHRFKLLPLAGVDAGRFHLRISNVAPTKLLANLGRLRRGTFAHPAIFDFLVDEVHLEFTEPVPFQVAGELLGERQTLTIAASRSGVDLVRFL